MTERHESRRSSSLGRSRCRALYHDYDCYDSKGFRRHQYRDSHCSEQENRDRYKYYHDDDEYSKHSAYSSYRRERDYSPMDHRRNSRSKSQNNVRNSHGSGSRSPDPIGEDNSNDNATQQNIKTVTETTIDNESIPAITTDSSGKLTGGTKPPVEAISSEVQEEELETEVLEVFGERIRPERVLALAVHNHLATI